jgi:hypothetical protein
LFPSKAVADQFAQWNVVTAAGVTVGGLLVEETANHVTLRDANGKDTRFGRKDVVEKEKSPTSLMPSDIAQTLTENELTDMVEYLTTLKTPALSLPRWHVVGPFAGDDALDRAFGPEKGYAAGATYQGATGPIGWQLARPDSQGYVDLQTYHHADKAASAAYIAGAVESPIDQPGRVLLRTTGGAKLWVNGELIHASRKRKPVAAVEDTIAINLRTGRNDILLKTEGGQGPAGVFLTILSEKEIRAADDGVK